MTPSFWSGKRVLITGNTGFKGTWLTLWLKSLGAHLCGYSLAPNTNPSMYQVVKAEQDIRTITANVTQLDKLFAVFQDFQPEVAIHLAAQPLVRDSYANPVETYSTNVMGTVHFLESVRNTVSVRVALVITSDKCYVNNEWEWGYREHDRLGGVDPYSSSKACAELVSMTYRQAYHSPEQAAIATARAGNVIGGGDWSKDRLVPDVIRALSRCEPLTLRNPTSIRAWQFVLEPLSGYLLLAEKMWGTNHFREAWNFGPDSDGVKDVAHVVRGIASEWGLSGSFLLAAETACHEAKNLNLDSSKARARLGWRPQLSLDEAIAWTSVWYHSFASGDDMRAFTLHQLKEYQNRILK